MHALRRKMILFLAGAVLVSSHRVSAQSVVDRQERLPPARPQQVREPAEEHRALVDPTLLLLERVSKKPRPSHSIFARTSTRQRRGALVSLRFRRTPDRALFAELSDKGVDFGRDGNQRVRRLGRVCRAWIPWEALTVLSQHPDIAQIEALWQPALQLPLEVTSDIAGAAPARTHPEYQATGKGTTVALIDTGIDVLHPAFFRADGGLFAWIDANQNDVFDPGIDAVDLDGDGQAGHNETLRVLDATTVVDFGELEFNNDNGTLEPARDWVYADMNGDRARNVGVGSGFNEDTPAYGEAIFVVDDADRDGVLEPGEKLSRLGTSKVRRYVTESGTFVRGANLIEAGAGSSDALFHGTGSAGILAGGQAGYHDRVGVAPGADLLVYGLGAVLMKETTLPLEYLDQAVDDGADIVLHEWTNAFTQPLDGSTNFEAAMAAAREAGAIQVNPVGNLNLAQKHIQREAAAGETVTLSFQVDDGFESRGEVLPYLSVFGSLQWRGESALSVAVESPEGERVSLEPDVGSYTVGGSQLDVTRETTARGTTVLRFYLEAVDESAPITVGSWSFELSGFSQDDTVYGRITDAYSNWAPGVVWAQPSPDTSTLAFPATADAAVGVSAFAARHATPIEGGAQPGDLRRYSGRGPRIDGARAVDIAAPDDPFVPLGATPGVIDAGWGRSWFTPFGGTSGAAPHVAGGLALLRQKSPDASPDTLEAALLVAARADEWTPAADELPDTSWGHGKLDLYRALFDASPAPNEPPRAALEAVVEGDRVRWDASGTLDPDGDALEFRFDVDYDGVWDTDWLSEPNTSSPAAGSAAPSRWGRLEVRDEHGAHHGAVARIAEHTAGGAETGGAETPDAGDAVDAGLENPTDSCCATAPGIPLPAPLPVALGLGLLLAARRRLHSTK